MELFVFLRMGGVLDRCVVLPFGTPARASRVSSSTDPYLETYGRLLQFDAGKAQCFDPDDRSYLLVRVRLRAPPLTPTPPPPTRRQPTSDARHTPPHDPTRPYGGHRRA